MRSELDHMSVRLNELYYAPGMPGYLQSLETFRDRCSDATQQGEGGHG
jgi:hypothetical protein